MYIILLDEMIYHLGVELTWERGSILLGWTALFFLDPQHLSQPVATPGIPGPATERLRRMCIQEIICQHKFHKDLHKMLAKESQSESKVILHGIFR